MATEYDITRAFEAIENELMASMIRNFEKHRAEEIAEGFDWEMWQSVQLRELERYRKMNAARFQDMDQVYDDVETILRASAAKGEKTAAQKIEDYINDHKFRAAKKDITGPDFLRINDARLTAMIEATKADFNQAKMSMLRQAEDRYRKTIFNAQVYSSTGATYEQAVDMATKDFLRAGINCVIYRNGSRHTVPEYTRMALRTGQKRAYLMGQGNTLDYYGIHTVRVNSRTHACPKCSKFLNRVLVDDVYAGGTRQEAIRAGIPTLSDAINEGFLHPNCKDVYSLYIPGISRPAEEWTRQDLIKITKSYNKDQELKHAQDMYESYKRMSEYSLDPENKRTYGMRAEAWKQKLGRNDD